MKTSTPVTPSGASPPRLPIDFNEQTLAERLLESGYDERCQKTLVLWQGVTQYLTRTAVGDILGFVVGHA